MSLINLFVAIIAIYILCSPRFAAWFYRPILFPRLKMASHENPPQIAEIKAKAVKFMQVDGNYICAWFYRNVNAKLTLLVSHGNYGNMQTHSYLTEALLKAGYSVFIYDYSGYGASTGLPDLANITNDAEAAYDYLVQSENLKPENIILYGESIGGSITSYLASVRKVRAIICQSGFSALRAIATEKMSLLRIYPQCLFPRHKLDMIKNLTKVKVPVLIIHGMKDDIVPFHHAQAIFEAATYPKTLVSFAECNHSNVTFFDRDRFIGEIRKFLT